MRYFCRVEYEGSIFKGWQVQPGMQTVQQSLEDAISRIVRHPVRVTGAGRTDAGVHAVAMGMHFDTATVLDVPRFSRAVNAVLPKQIAIYSLQQVADDFHARFSACSRSYRYTILSRKHPLYSNRGWVLEYAIDWGVLKVELPTLLGTHDFSTFCASGSGSAHAVCTVQQAKIEKEGECMVFSITANRFVYNMVRSITGTLIDIGRGKQQLSLREILERKDRSVAGTTAPACGLVLCGVDYREVESW